MAGGAFDNEDQVTVDTSLGSLFAGGQVATGTNLAPGHPGPAGPQGPGYSSGMYDASTGMVTLVGVNGATNVVTGDLRGMMGAAGNAVDGVRVVQAGSQTQDTIIQFTVQGTDIGSQVTISRGPQGQQGVQGEYRVDLFLVAPIATPPPTPTDIVWTPGPGGGMAGGTNSRGWGTVPLTPGPTEQIYEVTAIFDPATETQITTWSAVFLAGSQGPTGPQGPRGFTLTATQVSGSNPGDTSTLTLDSSDPSVADVVVTIQPGVQGMQGDRGFGLTATQMSGANPGDTSTVTFDSADPNVGDVTVTIQPGAPGTDGATDITVEDEGNELSTTVDTINFVGSGVTATGSGTDITVRVDSGGGTPPTPQEHFTFNLNPTQITEGTGSTTVTATFGVSGTGFTYVGYAGLAVSGPTTITLNDRAGTDHTAQFSIPNGTVGTYRVTAYIESNNSSGDALPRHAVSGSIHVNAQWYGEALASPPTSEANLTGQGAYHSGVSQTFTGIVGGRLYIALPTTAGTTPTFRSGIVFIDYTQITSGWTSTTHNLFDLGELAAGTLTVEVT